MPKYPSKHKTAAQILHARNIKLYAGKQQILKYTGRPNYDITPIKESIIVQPGRQEEKPPFIKRIRTETYLRGLGYTIQARKARPEEVTRRNQRMVYHITKYVPGKQTSHMPKNHHVEYDLANKRLRLVGPNAGSTGAGPWISMTKQASKPTIEFDINDYVEAPDEVIDHTIKDMLNLPDEPVKIEIPEIPVLMTEANEIICIPQTRDEPTLAAVGQKRSGKTYLIHGIADRVYWKSNWKKLVAFLNDKLMDTETYSLPNPENTAQLKIRNVFNADVRPLPMVHLSPTVELLDGKVNIIHPGEIGFEISLPWKELVAKFDAYFKLDKSEAYFAQLRPLLARCESPDEAIGVVEESDLHTNVKAKIIAAMTKFFNSKILDFNTGVPSMWTVQTPSFEGTYNPVTASLLAGIVPSLYTEQLMPKDFYPQYFKYIVEDLFVRQSTDPYFAGNQLQIWLFIDEVLDVASRENKTVATQILKELVTQGGPKRIGTFMATQNFLKIEERVRSNIKYLFAFVNPSEAASIASQYSLSREWAEEIKTLRKFECVAITTEEFVVYDAQGRKRRSKGPFKGKAVPPLSMHRAPRDAIEIDRGDE